MTIYSEHAPHYDRGVHYDIIPAASLAQIT